MTVTFTINKEVSARLKETGRIPLTLDFCTSKCWECSICRTPLIAEERKTLKKCYSCGQTHKTKLFCPNGHFICNRCWKKIADCPNQQNPVKMRLLLAEKLSILPTDIEVKK